MLQINLLTSSDYDGCYNGDKKRWEIYIDEKNISNIFTDLSLSNDGYSYWHCYLESAKWLPRQQKYYLIYKDY